MAADNAPPLTFGQTVPVIGVQTTVLGNHPDLKLTFGACLSTLGNSFFLLLCDTAVLVRGQVPCN